MIPGELDVDALRRVAGCGVVGVSVDGARQVAPVGTASVDTVFRLASLTKALTAVAAVLACRRTATALSTRLVELLPELRDGWTADLDLTIADVLSQTSGLAPTVTSEDISRLGELDTASLAAARLVVGAGSVRPRGASWEYYNGNYFLAGAVVAALWGTTYETALDELVLRPWRLRSASFEPARLAQGVEDGRTVPAFSYPRGRRPSGGLCATATDLLAFGEQVLADGGLLSDVAAVRTRDEDPMRYGLGWALGPSGQMYLNGRLPGSRSALLIVPDHRMVAVALAASSEALPAQAQILSDLQRDLTGDDLARAIEDFAA